MSHAESRPDSLVRTVATLRDPTTAGGPGRTVSGRGVPSHLPPARTPRGDLFTDRETQTPGNFSRVDCRLQGPGVSTLDSDSTTNPSCVRRPRTQLLVSRLDSPTRLGSRC